MVIGTRPPLKILPKQAQQIPLNQAEHAIPQDSISKLDDALSLPHKDVLSHTTFFTLLPLFGLFLDHVLHIQENLSSQLYFESQDYH